MSGAGEFAGGWYVGKWGNNVVIRSMLIPIFTCFCILSASCASTEQPAKTPGNASVPSDDSVAAARQVTVDAMNMLPSGYEKPEVGYDVPDSPRLEGCFDVNQYFFVLTHLSPQPGYTLDYVYANSGSDARPYLYARKIDSKPYSTTDELAKTYSDETYIDATKDHDYDYLAYVQTDDSEEGYFQYVVLYIMGGQFYLWWHANYNDRVIICDHAGLEKTFAATQPPFQPPTDVQNKARLLDFAPKVEISKDTVNVRVVVFTDWGGFIEETYTITRAFPHIIKDVKTKTLVEWNANVTF